MTNKKPIKKGRNPKETTNNIRNELKDCGTLTPPYEPDIEFIHNIIRAELAVVKAEEEKKHRSWDCINFEDYDWDHIMTRYYNWWIPTELWDLIYKTRKDKKDKIYNEEKLREENKQKEHNRSIINPVKRELKQKYQNYLIRSIISSLWLWATAMFLYLNT